MKSNEVSNFEINGKTALFIGGAILVGSIVGFAVFGQKKEEKTVVIPIGTFGDVLDKNKDRTSLDEILELNENIGNKLYVINEKLEVFDPESFNSDEKIYLSDCIKNLELYFQLHSDIEELALTDNDELKEVDDETKALLFSKVNDKEYVNSLINTISGKSSTDIERARALQKLKYLDRYYRIYISFNGLTITEDLLKKTLKSYVCIYSGLEPQNYNSCRISGDEDAKEKDITVTDPISGLSYEYYIDETSGIVNEVLADLYDVQNFRMEGNFTTANIEQVEDVCIPALNNAKTLINIGVMVRNNVLLPMTNNVNNTKVKAKGKNS